MANTTAAALKLVMEMDNATGNVKTKRKMVKGEGG